jgi:SAM-dependent methyltransferase
MTRVWIPRLLCPECRAVIDVAAGALRCAGCGAEFAAAGRCYDFLAPDRRRAKEPFFRQYRAVRAADGFRSGSAGYYRALPDADAADPRAGEWRIRRETFRTLVGELDRRKANRWRVLDLGAGNGWLSNRLAERGHEPVAVDVFPDDSDGLGACVSYLHSFCTVRADFDALPFEAGQFDLVAFNASLHYAPEPDRTLRTARGMLANGGVLVVMDSPLFEDEADGKAMADEQADAMRRRHDLADVERPGKGFLTFAGLDQTATALGLRTRFAPSRGPLAWRVRRPFARRRLGRAPASFGLWMAQ